MMPNMPDVPEARDVLRLHQWDEPAVWEDWRCTCGLEQPEGQHDAADDDACDAWMADHQLAMLTGARLSIVPTHGTAAVVVAAANMSASLTEETSRRLTAREAVAVSRLQGALQSLA